MMEKVRLGRTGLMVSRVSMGCIPIQRLSQADAAALLRRALAAGVNFFDTAYVYGDSEEKIGAAFADVPRSEYVIATKTMSDSYEKTMSQLEESLRRLRTDYIDLYQWHNPETFDGKRFLDERGPYQAMLDAQKAGKVRFLGITNHHLARAHAVIDCGAFDTLQFPLSALSSPEEIAMTVKCAEKDMGVIAMKAMCGGLLDDGRLPFAFLHQYPHIVPIWGLEKTAELDQFIALSRNPEPFTEEMRAAIEKLRAEYGDSYCRGCGYCLPCPAGITLPIMMRITLFVKRNAVGSQFTPARIAEVERIDKCIECRACVKRCPYHLEVPAILKTQKERFDAQLREYEATR